MTLAVALPQSLVGLWLALLVDGVQRRRPQQGDGGRASAWRCPRPCCGGCRSSSTGSAVGSATGSRSRWRPTSPSCTPPSPPSPTRNGGSTWTGWRCCAGTPSGSTTCSCRCSPRSAGCCGWPSSRCCWSPGCTRRSGCWCCSRCPPWSPRPGGRASSRPCCEREAQHQRRVRHLFVLGHDRPAGQGAAGHRQRRSTSPSAAGPSGGRCTGRCGRAKWGTAAVEQPGLGGVRAGLRRRRGVHGERRRRLRRVRSCSCWWSAASSRSSSARRSASSASCAASGWTSRAG